MGETADEIRNQIEETRAKIGQDLNELEHKVRRETDWRVHFDRRPWAFMGAAFSAAVLFGLIVGTVTRR